MLYVILTPEVQYPDPQFDVDRLLLDCARRMGHREVALVFASGQKVVSALESGGEK